MSYIHRCDRCGIDIPKSENIKMAFTHRITMKGKIFFDWFRSDDEINYERDIELCAECNDSFIDWFNDGSGTRKLARI